MHAEPIKYEVDKESGAIFVDRFMSTAMHYHATTATSRTPLPADGDPVDVLVISQFALPPGIVVRCRPIGMLNMNDEAGEDASFWRCLWIASRDVPHVLTHRDCRRSSLTRLLISSRITRISNPESSSKFSLGRA